MSSLLPRILLVRLTSSLKKHDYISPQYILDSLVRVVYSNHPGDRARDIRARPFIVEWATPNRNPPKSYVKHPRPVFRVSYFCKGNHDPGRPTSDPEATPILDEDDDCDCDDRDEENHECQKIDSGDEGSQADSVKKGRSSKRDRCPQQGKIVVSANTRTVLECASP